MGYYYLKRNSLPLLFLNQNNQQRLAMLKNDIIDNAIDSCTLLDTGIKDGK